MIIDFLIIFGSIAFLGFIEGFIFGNTKWFPIIAHQHSGKLIIFNAFLGFLVTLTR